MLVSSSAIVLISHDRYFLEKLTNVTVWLNGGRSLILNKGFSAFEAWRDKKLEQENSENYRLNKKIAREEQWLHGGISGRRKRNVKRVAELVNLRQERKNASQQVGSVSMVASLAKSSSKLVVEVKGLSKAFGSSVVIKNFSLRVARGDRVGLVGPNGAGKTTLLKLLLGDMQADSGSIRLGSNLEIVSLDQNREILNLEETLANALVGGSGDTVTINGQTRHVTSYMKDFLFLPEQARSPLKVLSGGERARVMLARAFAKPSNLLVLDEPTNDLDLETLDLLQEIIADYPGTVFLISHDRSFLDRTVTSVVISEGDGCWVKYPGGYSDMLLQRSSNFSDNEHKASGSIPNKLKKFPTTTLKSKSGYKKNLRKLSFKDKYALEQLSKQMEKLNSEIKDIEHDFNDADLFFKFPERFKLLSSRLKIAQNELLEAEEAWLELEIKREKLEG
ncbi:MAG: ATP-binding cassette domain-containing protein [Hyphomicrobiaceae bacterium]|nr:ATP-binding cassette domain-containing protein [Hyphomicrobiaceae bacterium]